MMPRGRLAALLAWASAEIDKHEAYAVDFEARARSGEAPGAAAMAAEHRACARTLESMIAADKARASTFVPNFDGYPPSEAAPYIAAELRSLAAQLGSAEGSPAVPGDAKDEAVVEGALAALQAYAYLLETRANELDPVAEALPDKEIVP